MLEARDPIPVTAVTLGTGEVDTALAGYTDRLFKADNDKIDSSGTPAWGIWATDHMEAFLFAVEMDSTSLDYVNGIGLWGHRASSNPSSIHTGILTWDGDILGVDNSDTRFDGDIRLTVDTSLRHPNGGDVVNIRIDNLTGGTLTAAEPIDYPNIRIHAFGRFAVYDDLDNPLFIDGRFFGDQHQAVGGKISNPSKGIKLGIFGAKRTK